MSTHPIPSPTGDPADSIRWERALGLQGMARAHLGRESTIADDGTTLSLVFTPNLTAPQTATLGRLIAISGLLRITPAEWAAIESDIQNGRDYLQAASPTAAQTVAALKSAFRILRALIRD